MVKQTVNKKKRRPGRQRERKIIKSTESQYSLDLHFIYTNRLKKSNSPVSQVLCS